MQPGGHPLLLLLACPLILADGLPFDTELYPPSLDMAHNLLSKEQLLHMFGVQEAHMVDHTRWAVVVVLLLVVVVVVVLLLVVVFGVLEAHMVNHTKWGRDLLHIFVGHP